MLDLNDIKISFLICSPEHKELSKMDNNNRCNKFLNILYSMNYTIVPIYAYDKGIYEKNYIAICSKDNDKLRTESIFIMNSFNKEDIVVKYKGESILSKIINDGNELPVEIIYYDGNNSKKIYINEGVSFSLNDKERYFFPKKKEELKSGMIVEYLNNNKWQSKEVSNIDIEYEKMYKLLMKYEKLRVSY